jgi:hypothetical protein
MEKLLLGLSEISGCQSFQQKELSQPAVEVIYIMVFLFMLPALVSAGYQFAVSIQAVSLSLSFFAAYGCGFILRVLLQKMFKVFSCDTVIIKGKCALCRTVHP